MMLTNTIKSALELANKVHENQIDLQGQPYINHILRVAGNVAKNKNYSDIQFLLAILHDIVEDSDISLDYIKEQFGTEIASKLNLLTRKAGQSYGDYIKALAEDLDCIVVKLADLCDNMDLSRFKNGLEESDEKRILKYKKWYNYLIERKELV